MAIMDRVVGSPCTGTEGNDTSTGYPERDVLLGFKADAAAADCSFCVPGFDTINQEPGILGEKQGTVKRGDKPDIIAEDYE
jgi:hypothetical protein